MDEHATPANPQRRRFLQSSALAAGGLTLGVTLPLGRLAVAAAGNEGFQPNAWLHIAPDGATTLWCGRCEMGQGISTALPAAVADELEADWDRVTVLQADGNKDKYGPQNTGGSRSINVMLEPMRKAGAAAREMLITAAAQRWGLAVADCYADKHAVANKRDQRRLSYGELAADAALLPVPAEPRLKGRDEFRYIGRPPSASPATGSLHRHKVDQVAIVRRALGLA